MALGRPVLVHDGGALCEQVINEVNGFKINCLDLRTFAGKIIELSETDFDALKNMGVRARQIYLKRWSPSVIIQSLIDILEEASKESTSQ
jgi:glycosyltransferase involved in cell wall biosynthesis